MANVATANAQKADDEQIAVREVLNMLKAEARVAKAKVQEEGVQWLVADSKGVRKGISSLLGVVAGQGQQSGQSGC